MLSKILSKWLRNRSVSLEELIQKADEKLHSLPDGRLRLCTRKGVTDYYHVVDAKKNTGVYIKKENKKLAEDLAQKDYLNQVRRVAEHELTAIHRILDVYPEERPEDVYSSLREERRKLVTSITQSDDEYAKWWQSQKVPENPSHPEEKCFATKRGEYVRSKAEVMIADAYYEMGIPYICEYPIDVGNGVTRFCDFALLDKRTRKVYYHEHFGMLDKPEYLMKNLRKLSEYRAVGIYTGKNLILTCEADGCPLDMNLFRKNVADFFGISR